MAPRILAKRKAAEAKTSRQEHPSLGSAESFPTTKEDKRRMKHSRLVSRIEKSTSKAKPKRRRPSKKLVTTLESLANALPETKEGSKLAGLENINVIKHKSLKSRPGAMKKRGRLEAQERARFQKNLAEMATSASKPPQSEQAQQSAVFDTSSRWAALRNFISSTMDKTMSA